jgi:hypothetical protein
METFTYLGLTFAPYKRLTGKDADFHAMSARISDKGLTPEGWSYEGFYKAAGSKKIDLFALPDGRIVCPATNNLFEYK